MPVPVPEQHGATSPTAARPPGVRLQLGELVAAAAAAWPEIRIDPEVFAIYVTTRLPSDVPTERALAAVHADDLYLAAGCALADPRAAAELDRVHLQALPGVLACTGLDRARRHQRNRGGALRRAAAGRD